MMRDLAVVASTDLEIGALYSMVPLR